MHDASARPSQLEQSKGSVINVLHSSDIMNEANDLEMVEQANEIDKSLNCFGTQDLTTKEQIK